MRKHFPREWLILLTTFVTLVVIYGIWYSYSVYLVALTREFGWSRSLVSGAFSFFVVVHGAIGPLVGWLLRRMGTRRPIMAGGLLMALGLFLTAETESWWQLYGAFGVIAAVGMSLCGWIPAVVLVQAWFPARVGTAMGLASGGIGVGILAMVPLSQLLIDWWGWRWAFRLEALLAAAWVVPATYWLIREPVHVPRPAAEGERPASASAWTLTTAARTLRFWGLAAVYFSGNFVTQMLLIHQVAYLVDHGVPGLAAATVAGTVGLVSIPAKVAWGLFSDRRGREAAVGLAFAFVVAGVGALVLAGRFPVLAALYGYAVLMGLGYSVLSGVFPAICADLYSGPRFPTIYGALYVMVSLGLAAGAWFAGAVFDATGSYAGALWVGVALAAVTPALLWLVAPGRPNPAPKCRVPGM
jgi:MFS family permease